MAIVLSAVSPSGPRRISARNGSLIALAMLSLGGYRPNLPGRPVTS